MLMKRFLMAVMAAVAVLIVGCSETTNPRPDAREMRGKTLVVGMDADYPPLTFKNAHGDVQGIEVDFAKALGKELGRPVRIEILPWLQLKEALDNHIVDIVMNGVSVTKQREGMMLFSRPYMKIAQMAIMREGAPLPNLATKGAGLRIGFQRYTTSEKFVKQSFPQAELVPAATMREGVINQMSGKTDYFFADAPAIWYYTSTNTLKGLMGWYVPYTLEDLAWAMPKGSFELKKEVDAVIAKWQKNGFINQTLTRWMPVQVITPQDNELVHFD
jgi:polar amino acid transport system substrate-binding protein